MAELWLDVEDETSTSSATQEDIKNQTKDIMNHMTKISMESTSDIKRELQSSYRKIISLQNEINERDKAIEELLITRKNTKNIYYVGLLTGGAGIIAGIFTNIVYAIAGLCVAVTALVGIYEAKRNNW